MIALKGFQLGWNSWGLLVDALHFHRRLKNLPYSGWKVGPAGCTSEHPSLHTTFNEGTFVFRSEQAEH